MAQQISEPFDLLLGEQTYEIWVGYWPKHMDGGFGAAFAKATKYVVVDEDVDASWEKTAVIKGDAVEELKKISCRSFTGRRTRRGCSRWRLIRWASGTWPFWWMMWTRRS